MALNSKEEEDGDLKQIECDCHGAYGKLKAHAWTQARQARLAGDGLPSFSEEIPQEKFYQLMAC